MSIPRRIASASLSAVAAVGFFLAGAPAAAVQEGVVLAVRPEGVVVDLGQIEGAQRGTRLGFVHEDGGLRETGQGAVMEVRDGKALVRLAPGGVANQHDAVVLCPAPGQDDQFTALRAALNARQDDATPVVGEIKSALAKRDAAIGKGACYTGDLDRQIAMLADQLDGTPSGNASSDQDAAAPPPAQGDSPARERSASTGAGAAIESTAGLVEAITKLTESLGRNKDRSARTSVEPDSPSAPIVQPPAENSAPSGNQAQPPDVPPDLNNTATPSAPASAQPGRSASTPVEKRAPGSPPWWQAPSAKPVGPKIPTVTKHEPVVAGTGQRLTLTGRVVDQSGRPVPGATITIDGASTHSNVQGAFKLDNVKPGRHEIKATAAGFRADARMVSVNHGALEAVTFTLRRADATSQHSAPQPLTPQRSMQPRKLGQDRVDESFDKDH